MRDGLDMTALREVKFLQELQHPNIIAVRMSSRITPLLTLSSSTFSQANRTSIWYWSSWTPTSKL